MVSPASDQLRRAYAAFNKGAGLDWSLIDPAIQHDQSEGLFLDGVFYGREGVRAALQEIELDWEDLTYTVEDVVELGDRVLLLLRMQARVRGSEAELDAQVAHVWQFQNGRAVRWDVYGDRASALRAISATGPFGAVH
jgi:ketosteroid isomerase-like protein